MIRRRGFTLLELLIVVAVIATLTGLVLAAAVLVQERRRRATARVQLQNLSLAISGYLGDHGILGDQEVETPTDVAERPALFLVQRPKLAGADPYYAAGPRELATAALQPADAATAEQLLNPWRQPVRVAVRNARSAPSRPFDHTREVELRSGPAGADSGRDVVIRYDHDRGGWEWR